MRPITLVAAGLAAWLASAAHAQTFEQTGAASWYGDRHHGKKTASGERFDMHKLSAAHRKLPLGSVIEVTNLANDRTVELRVNDRGPFSGHRVLDVSKAAAEQLGFIGAGTANVRIRLVEPKTEELRPQLPAASEPAPELVLASAAPEPVAAAADGFLVRVGVFSVRANAQRAAERVGSAGTVSVSEDWASGRILHRVAVTGLSDRAAAEAARDAIVAAGFADAQVVEIEG